MKQTYLVAFAGYDQHSKWTMDKKNVDAPSDISSAEREKMIKDILSEQSSFKNLTIMTTLLLSSQTN